MAREVFVQTVIHLVTGYTTHDLSIVVTGCFRCARSWQYMYVYEED